MRADEIPTADLRADRYGTIAGQPDPKPAPRVRDIGVLRRLHLQGGVCVLCDERGESLHHLLPRSRGGDDVDVNLVWLCGSGTTGCHGRVEAWDQVARTDLGTWVLTNRFPEFHGYLVEKLGSRSAAEEFLSSNLYILPAG